MADSWSLFRCHSILAPTLLLSTVLYGVTVSSSSPLLSSSISGHWKRVTHRAVISFLKKVRARSSTECVQQCQQMGACGSAAFDSASSICYLQPSHRPWAEGDGGPAIAMYTIQRARGFPQDPLSPHECKTSDAPVVPNALTSSWRMTSSTLQCDVICHEDYTLSQDVTPLLRCPLESGNWVVPATCNQYTWRSYTATTGQAYPLPRTPAQVGWCLRTKGIPTAETCFEIDLMTSDGNILLHFFPRFNCLSDRKVTVVNYFQDGAWGPEVRRWDPFPFALGISFEVVITAVSSYQYEVQVNGADYVTFTAVRPVSDIDTVMVKHDVQVEDLNLWC